jgi:hypothetical protein
MKQIRLSNAAWLPLLLLSAGLSGLGGCKKGGYGSDSNNNNAVPYSGTFVKSDSAVSTSATGTLTASLDPGTKELSYTFTWQGLSGNAVGMHIHDNGPIIIPISDFPKATSGTYSGKATLTDAQVNDLIAGKLYGQIHTENYPAGEILAVLTRDDAGGGMPPPDGGYTPPPSGGGYN